MNIIYSTSTPIIATKQYHFTYPSKRHAYVDACYAIFVLNKVAKEASRDMRFYIYRLKNRWIEMLYRRGYCVRAELGERLVWELVFLVDGVKFQWHLPSQIGTYVQENKAPVYYEWQDHLLPHTRSLAESIVLLEWCLN